MSTHAWPGQLKASLLQLCWRERHESWVLASLSAQVKTAITVKTAWIEYSEKGKLCFAILWFLWKALNDPSTAMFSVPLVVAPSVQLLFLKAPHPNFIIYTLEGNWWYCFLRRKRKGVCGGLKGCTVCSSCFISLHFSVSSPSVISCTKAQCNRHHTACWGLFLSVPKTLPAEFSLCARTQRKAFRELFIYCSTPPCNMLFSTMNTWCSDCMRRGFSQLLQGTSKSKWLYPGSESCEAGVR